MFSGIPSPPNIISEPQSEESNSYNLNFSSQSFEPLTEVMIKYWTRVRRIVQLVSLNQMIFFRIRISSTVSQTSLRSYHTLREV